MPAFSSSSIIKRVCQVDGCGRRYLAKGYCSLHYLRQKFGRPMGAPLWDRGWQLRDDGTKWCNVCKQYLEAKFFSKSESARDGLSPGCQNCRNKKAKEYRTPEIRRKYRLKADYGLTIEEYQSILEKQNGLCLICQREETRRGSKILSIDHDHRTGRIRGLLCHSCNVSIGHMRESSEIIQRMVAYLDGDL